MLRALKSDRIPSEVVDHLDRLRMYFISSLLCPTGLSGNPFLSLRARGVARTRSDRKRASDAKPYSVVPIVGGVPVADCRAEGDCNAIPGTTAVNTVATSATGEPRRAVGRRVLVIGVVAILYPLQDVALHVVQTELVGWK